MSTEPTSITRSAWYRLIPPLTKPETWDLCVGNGQHLGWDRCWAFVLSHNLDSRGLAIVWSIGYAMKAACEESEAKRLQKAYEAGWRDACDDHLEQKRNPSHPIGGRRRAEYVPEGTP